ncbi:MAG: Ig-like domain-containing protein [bacterium]
MSSSGGGSSVRGAVGRWSATALLALAGLLCSGAVCDILFGEDRLPPVCRIIQPTDSSAVSGNVAIRAEASDSSGVSSVEFYVDGSLISTDLAAPYSADWDASQLPDRSWHTMFCRARDPYDNIGTSDTIRVQVWLGGTRDVLHGAFRLEHNYYWLAGFAAAPGDTLAGSMRVASGGVLSRFIWLDAANYGRFSTGQSYSPIVAEVDRQALSLREHVTAADSFYLVFLNTSGAPVEVWARFTLE